MLWFRAERIGIPGIIRTFIRTKKVEEVVVNAL